MFEDGRQDDLRYSDRENPEDRRNRFPVRFRRSEGPKPSPRMPRAFHVGIIMNEQQSPNCATPSTHLSSAVGTDFVSGKVKKAVTGVLGATSQEAEKRQSAG